VIIGASAAIVLGGAAIAIIDGVSPSRSRDVNAGESAAIAAAADSAPARPEPTADAGPPSAPKPAALRRAAIAQLETLRATPSPRVARLAAMALAQTRRPEAVEALAAMYETETSALNRVAMAHALARAGDPRGLDALVEALGDRRRDVRADAAIALTRLDDRRGDRVLRSILHIRDHKIAAAGHLARGGDDKARALLEKIYRDERAEREMRMRAAVALGSAGVAEVADFLTETLADGRYRVGAAAALATLGNEAAREPLERQLELNAMRVQAADALATLGGEVDLAPLAIALTHDDEVSRVTSAEAILILTRGH
jgi:HEAT repeat protein